ncbi:MAG: hypothetical protein EOP61_19505, partial [Sphingomonadales bacterium]
MNHPASFARMTDRSRQMLRPTIGFKILGIAVGLLLLTMIAALTVLRMTQKVDDQLAVISRYYFPAYSSLAQANNHSLAESALIRREMLAFAEVPRNPAKIADLGRRAAAVAADSDAEIASARRLINAQINDTLDFDDNVALARLDTRVEFLQQQRRRYEHIRARLVRSTRDRRADAPGLLAELDATRDDFDDRIEAAQVDMRQLAN